ncbi:MAG: AbrB/MazE/SpoVT family DNA-binding domain-containing protein [Rhodoferax sp.]
MPTTISRVFMNGNSQAVRIPQEFRLDTSQVEIFRNSDGDLVLHAVPADRGAALLEALNAFDDEFVALLEVGQHEQLPTQDRESL